jgi:hypothetical protein
VLRRSGIRWLRLALLAAVLLALCGAGGWAAALCDLRSWVGQGELFSAVVCAATSVYVLAMALPFIPGIEIGLALMLVLGAEGVVLVYLCTQLALALSYLAGRVVPPATLARAFAFLGMERARRLLTSPAGAIPRPGLALAALLNLPGNAVIGGAGGIGMLAGITRALSFPRYLLLVALATTPVPAVLLLGARL